MFQLIWSRVPRSIKIAAVGGWTAALAHAPSVFADTTEGPTSTSVPTDALESWFVLVVGAGVILFIAVMQASIKKLPFRLTRAWVVVVITVVYVAMGVLLFFGNQPKPPLTVDTLPVTLLSEVLDHRELAEVLSPEDLALLEGDDASAYIPEAVRLEPLAKLDRNLIRKFVSPARLEVVAERHDLDQGATPLDPFGLTFAWALAWLAAVTTGLGLLDAGKQAFKGKGRTPNRAESPAPASTPA